MRNHTVVSCSHVSNYMYMNGSTHKYCFSSRTIILCTQFIGEQSTGECNGIEVLSFCFLLIVIIILYCVLLVSFVTLTSSIGMRESRTGPSANRGQQYGGYFCT